ncbi:MAG TPA: TetR/AcrR family transcriptional regulator [Methanomicrobiales archaeon]|nr:TetR/AcrR family transcriptional regulator [Methanomicrobiales archaeon]
MHAAVRPPGRAPGKGKEAGHRAARLEGGPGGEKDGKRRVHRRPASGDGVANRDRILGAALRLFTTRGFHHTPTAQISREAGVSTGTLFHYFPDKNTLIDELYLSIQREVAEAIRARDDATLPMRELLEGCFRRYIAWGVANPGKVAFLDQFYNSPSIGDDVKHEAHREFGWLSEMLATAIREGVVRDLPQDFYFVMIPQVLSGILALIREGRTTLTPDEIVRYGLALLLKE